MTPDQTALRAGIRGVLSLYIDEADLIFAVGESGLLVVNVQIQLDRGRAQWSKGNVHFERRIDLGGSRK